ncbi:hypothetical protein AYJ72_19065 [Salmonella enterica]|nr:hypothetical protein [Salmonella enterica]EAX3659019.1 hypothetical protein [Salmonella enterica]EAY8342195.1 hypothetical protein [Salmonella enterica]EBQ1068841.1 hypothetical protein [Salmonella enterica]EBQ1470831.1 hypothetical protein [Salmonella enterica]
MREQPETVLKCLEQATCVVTALWSRPLLTLKCASMPSSPGTTPRWTPPWILKWHCARTYSTR